MDKLAKIIREQSKEILDETIDLRRYLHNNPELSFKEFKTSEYICKYLDNNKIEYIKNIAGTGIIAWVNGENGIGGTIALRAELDALPIREATGLEYASRNDGIMHACGHDAHMAMLMSAIKIIMNCRDKFGGKIAFIFQPAEELAPGGARSVMESQAFKNLRPDLIIAQHVLPDLESGMLGFRPGKYMASSDEIHINIMGKGGHAALPDQSTDQVAIASELVLNLKEEVKNYDSSEPVVLGIGRFIAEGSTNIIPDSVSIEGTIRTFDEKVRKDILNIVTQSCAFSERKHGVEISLELPDGYPVLVNSTKFVEQASKLAAEINGKDKVKRLDRRMSSEDFAFFSQKYPVVFYRLGVKRKSEEIQSLHTPTFNIDENAMLTGVRTIAYLAIKNQLLFLK